MSEDEKLIALAKSLKLTGANNTDAALSKRLIVDAMASGRVVVNLQKRVAAPPKKAEELLPGPISYPPVQESAPLIPTYLTDPENGQKLAAQSASLVTASEKASAFCGQCEKEDCKAAGTETKPEKTEADSGNDAATVAVTNHDTAELTEPVETPKTEPKATADTVSDVKIETRDEIADTSSVNNPDSRNAADEIPNINSDTITPTGNINPTVPNNPLTGITDSINGVIPDNIPATTDAAVTNTANTSKSVAAIAAASTATALLSGGSAASALTDAPDAAEYSDYPDITSEPTEATSPLGDSTEPGNVLNSDAADQVSGQVPDQKTLTGSSESVPATTDTQTNDAVNVVDNSVATPETLTTGNVDTGSDIGVTSIATGAAATAAAAVASSSVTKVSSAKDSKIPPVKAEIEEVLPEQVDKVSLRQKNYQYRKELASNAGGSTKQQDAAQRLLDNNDNILRAEAAAYVYDVDEFNRGALSELPPAPVGLKLLDAKKIDGLKEAVLTSKESGFGAALFKSNINNEILLTYRGTNNGVTGVKDWKTNIMQGVGKETQQYNQAMRLALRAQKALGDNVVMVGHSLAGGLASAGTAVTGNPGYTFNSAGLHPKTVARFGGLNNDAASKLIQTRAVEGEVLTGAQRYGNKVLSGLSAAGGGAIGGPAGAAVGYLLGKTLPDFPQAIGEMKALPSVAGGSPVARHGMDQVIDGIEVQKKEDIKTLTL